MDALRGLLRDRERGAVDWRARADLNALEAPDEDDPQALDVHARAVAAARFARRMAEGDRAAWSEVVAEELYNEDLPFAFAFEWQVEEETDRIFVAVELPEEDVVPSREPTRRGGREIPARERRELYEDICCALVLRFAHELYRVIPDADEVYLVGYRPDRNPRDGSGRRAIMLRFMTDRESFARIDLDHVDPSDALEHLGGALARKRGRMVPLAYEDAPDTVG